LGAVQGSKEKFFEAVLNIRWK